MNVSALVTPAIKQATISPRQPSPRKCWIAWPNNVSLAARACWPSGSSPASVSGNAASAIKPVNAQAIVSSRLMKLP